MRRRRGHTDDWGQRAAHVLAAIHRGGLAQHARGQRDGLEVGWRTVLADDDPAMERLTPADRDWVRRHALGEHLGYGSLLDIVVKRCGAPPTEVDPLPRESLYQFVTEVVSPPVVVDEVVDIASRRAP